MGTSRRVLSTRALPSASLCRLYRNHHCCGAGVMQQWRKTRRVWGMVERAFSMPSSTSLAGRTWKGLSR